jgi:hypothetical protein
MTHALLTGAIAALMAALLGGPAIRFLRSRGLAKAISTDAVSYTHLTLPTKA